VSDKVNEHMKRGFLISVEGIDGCGKDTVCGMLEEIFAKSLLKAVTFADLYSTPLGAEVRKLFMSTNISETERMLPSTETFLINAARNENLLRNVLPALNNDRSVVILNRYHDSTRAYQHAVKGVEWGTIAMLETAVISDIVPVYTLLINTTPDVAAERMKEAGKGDYHESKGVEFHNAVFMAYARQYQDNPARILLIDGNGDKESVYKQLEGVVGNLIRVFAKGGYLLPTWIEATSKLSSDLLEKSLADLESGNDTTEETIDEPEVVSRGETSVVTHIDELPFVESTADSTETN
jgi:dTMP kinase